eukprot:m.289506 g.289506  ORF g.289506 m.289506 type:complete len:88 (+) comp16227_c3_seq1:1525-1788(+)
MSKCIEAYVQEAGRAGRDGKLSHCTMYISEEDMSRTKFFAQQSSENGKATKEARKAKEVSGTKLPQAPQGIVDLAPVLSSPGKSEEL